MGVILCIVDVGHWFRVVGSLPAFPLRTAYVSACLCVCVSVCLWYAALEMGIAHHKLARTLLGSKKKKVHTRKKNWCLVFTNFPYFHDNYSYHFYCSRSLNFFYPRPQICPGHVNFSTERFFFPASSHF